jgi:hypothetical protein
VAVRQAGRGVTQQVSGSVHLLSTVHGGDRPVASARHMKAVRWCNGQRMERAGLGTTKRAPCTPVDRMPHTHTRTLRKRDASGCAMLACLWYSRSARRTLRSFSSTNHSLCRSSKDFRRSSSAFQDRPVPTDGHENAQSDCAHNATRALRRGSTAAVAVRRGRRQPPRDGLARGIYAVPRPR